MRMKIDRLSAQKDSLNVDYSVYLISPVSYPSRGYIPSRRQCDTLFVGLFTYRLSMQKDRERVLRFIEAFESLYGRKPKPEDAEGDFKIQVAADMQMSVGGARYYLRLATEHEKKTPDSAP